MGILDDVVVNAKSAAQTVGKMAGQFVDMSKLRINLSELNGEINRRYQELGQFIYEAKKAGTADETELDEKIAGLDDLYAQLAASEQSHLPVLRQADGDRRDVLQSLRHEADEGRGAGRRVRRAARAAGGSAGAGAGRRRRGKDGGVIPPHGK